MKLKSIVGSQCESGRVALETEPALTKEVFDEAKLKFSRKLSVSFADGVIKVKGFGPFATDELFEHLGRELAAAHETIENDRKNKVAAHDSVVKQFSQVSGLPVT